MKKILKDVKQRGALVALRRLCSQLYGVGYYNLYYRPAFTTTKHLKPLPHRMYEIREISSDTDSSFWLEKLVDVWPRELEYYKRPAMFEFLQKRLRNGEVCFLLTDKENVLGAVWLGPLGKEWQNLIDVDPSKTFIVKSLFVVSQARGLGVSKYLFAHLFDYSNKAGKALLSFIKESRIASIKAHEAVGFAFYGRTLTRTLLGHAKHYFLPSQRNSN